MKNKIHLGFKESFLAKKEGYNSAFEIERQPDLWLEGLSILEDNKEKIASFIDKIKNIKNLKVILCGAGSSGIASKIAKQHISLMLEKEVSVILSTEMLTSYKFSLDNTNPILLVSISSSGSTPEGLETIRIIREKVTNLYEVFITCSQNGLMIKNFKENGKNLYIQMPSKTIDKSFAATAEFTNLILYQLVLFDIKNIQFYKLIFKDIANLSYNYFKNYAPTLKKLCKKKYNNIVFIGTNQFKDLAEEGNLKIIEFSNGLQSASFYSALEFRHGPKLLLNSKTLCVFFISADSYTQKYDIDMLKECFKDENKATIIAVSDKYIKELEENSNHYIYFSKNNEENTNWLLKNQYIINNLKFSHDSILGCLHDTLLTLPYALVLQTIGIIISLYKNVTPDLPNKEGKVPKIANKVTIYQ